MLEGLGIKNETLTAFARVSRTLWRGGGTMHEVLGIEIETLTASARVSSFFGQVAQ